MKDYVRDIWAMYHDTAQNWLRGGFASKATGHVIHDIFPFFPPEPVSTFSTEVIFSDRSPVSALTLYTKDTSVKYIKDTSKCTENPWTYYTDKHFHEVDFPWLEIILKDRTDNWVEIRKDLLEGAEEISRVKPCFDQTGLIEHTNNEVLLDFEEIVDSFLGTITDLVS